MLNADERIELIRSYKEPYQIFVETGTADGYTTKNLIGEFDRLITIELDFPRYLHVAVEEFLNEPTVMPLYGDSEIVLQEVVYRLTLPTLFWLDAHFSGGIRGKTDTPIQTELISIQRFCVVPHCILIDDARLFGSNPEYPSLKWVKNYADNNDLLYEENEDIIRLTPSGEKG